MVVQDQPDGAVRRIVSVQILQQGNELYAAMTLFHTGDYVAVVEIQRRQNGPGPIPDVLVIARDGGILARYRRQVRRGLSDRLHAGLFIYRNRDHRRRRAAL